MRDVPRSGWKSGSNTWLALKPVAREYRRALTPAENVLWQALRSLRKEGSAFRRQHAVGAYLVDFYCPRARLVVEVDGPIHDRQQEEDAHRTEFFEINRCRVLRFKNTEVLTNLGAVTNSIRAALDASPSP